MIRVHPSDISLLFVKICLNMINVLQLLHRLTPFIIIIQCSLAFVLADCFFWTQVPLRSYSVSLICKNLLTLFGNCWFIDLFFYSVHDLNSFEINQIFVFSWGMGLLVSMYILSYSSWLNIAHLSFAPGLNICVLCAHVCNLTANFINDSLLRWFS